MTAAAKVLIVEDEDSILLSLEFLLGDAGYSVSSAGDGDSALALLSQSVPDLALLDVMLPGIDGFELCRRIRADPRLSGMRVMMLTARGREADLQKSQEAGADAHITKPFSTRELVAKVRELLAAPPSPAPAQVRGSM